MDIFVNNIQSHAKTEDLRALFKQPLERCGIYIFECKKPKDKSFAFLTVPDEKRGNVFLQLHGVPVNSNSSARARSPLLLNGSMVRCSKSKNIADPLVLRSLKMREKRRLDKLKLIPTAAQELVQERHPSSSFLCRLVQCGIWAYNSNSRLLFIPSYTDTRSGNIIFGSHSFAILLLSESGSSSCRIDIPFSNIECIATGDQSEPSITFTLRAPPKISIPSPTSIESLMLNLTLAKGDGQNHALPRIRVSAINPEHEAVVGSCFVYRVTLSDPSKMHEVRRKLQVNRAIPRSIVYPTPVGRYSVPLVDQLKDLLNTLDDYKRYSEEDLLDFSVRFQLHRLASGGFLPPAVLKALLPHVASLKGKYGAPAVVTSLQDLGWSLPFAGPTEPAASFFKERLKEELTENAKSYKKPPEYSHLVWVHHAVVTPTTIYFEGPAQEPSNRVLRKYQKHSDYFLRVTFAEEDGGQLHFDPNVSLSDIFHKRFQNILREGIAIAGRLYVFLGFSNSSLRNQTCWFMAPFIAEAGLVHAQEVIKGLGEFSKFRCPAKCAARIGQAFSDSTSTVRVNPEQCVVLPDVERNGRTFSDGCGTISSELLRKVWGVYALSKTTKPTVLQIRFAGAKGVVSLDTRISGDKLCLRGSMVKFDGTDIADIEICGASFKPLPMYLNRPLIKILEDLGIPTQHLLDLQRTAVQRLREVTLTPLNASSFLEWERVATPAQTSVLIRLLGEIGLQFQQDDFLRGVVEIAALARLREIKHRSRIFVEDGATLYGVMDETGILKEGEIYCTLECPGGSNEVVAGGNIMITRSPALHPGDVRVVKAVQVPENSPLRSLRNCVVFSQQGERDLPSMLSGGDLDGDLYNVIWDPRLVPNRLSIHPPANYPRVVAKDIGREVRREDMSDFFIEFMENDQLGQIATLHQIYADQLKAGTFSPECVQLAEMASVAVDFSKSGRAVDMSRIPKGPTRGKLRPDFMATNPRVIIESSRPSVDEEDDPALDPDFRAPCPVAALDPERVPYTYYESEKALGFLYRDIDERKFLEAMKKMSETLRDSTKKSLMTRLWEYVERETRGFQWAGYLDLAREIRDEYEGEMRRLMAQYSTHPRQPLSELEVFCGHVLGDKSETSNGGGKRARQAAMDMRAAFERDCSWTVQRIIYGDGEEQAAYDGVYLTGREEALPRAVACLNVALMDRERGGSWLRSFGYVSAAIVLRELERFHGGCLRLR